MSGNDCNDGNDIVNFNLSPDIVSVMKSINEITRGKDALIFLDFLIEITKTKNIEEASVYLLQCTTRKCKFISFFISFNLLTGSLNVALINIYLRDIGTG